MLIYLFSLSVSLTHARTHARTHTHTHTSPSLSHRLTVWRTAVASVLRDPVHVEVWVDWMMVSQLEHFLKGVVDEDEADESRKALLCEAGEVLHQETGICGDQDQTQERRPQADPQPELQIVEIIIPEPIKNTHQHHPPTGGKQSTNRRTSLHIFFLHGLPGWVSFLLKILNT